MRARILQFFRSALALVPTLAVLAVLALLAIVGHLTEWKLSAALKLWQPGESAESETTPKTENPKPSVTKDSGVRFASREAVERSGVRTAAITKRRMSQFVSANGTIEYDRTRLAHLATRAPGTVWKVYRRLGESVHKGELLGLVDAADVGRAKAEFLQALRSLQLKTENLERLKHANARGAVAERMFQESEAAVAEARIRLFSAQQALANLGLPIHLDEVRELADDRLTAYLRFLGLPPATVQTFPATTTANLIPLVAPFDGVVIRSDMVEGEVVSSTPPQYMVADLSQLWVFLDVRQEEAGLLRKGQPLTFHTDGAPDHKATGKISWISTEVDDKTRTVRVRADVPNPQGLLRARSFGTGKILVAEEPDALAVPTAAIQWKGGEALVFVQQEDGLSFQPRPVRLGLRDGDFTEVIDGVRFGETVATAGSHMLRSQLFLNENPDKD